MRHFTFSMPGRAWNEDRAYSCEDFAFVLDGASALVKDQYSNMSTDAEWCSNWWCEYLKDALKDTAKTIPEILKTGVEISTKEFLALANGRDIEDFPCTTVSIVRRVNGALEMYALADSPIIVRAKSGLTIIFEDSLNTVNEGFNTIRIKDFAEKEHLTMKQSRAKHGEVLYRNISIKNKFGGYYVLADSVDAIEHGVYNYIEEDLIDKVLILSDGYSQVYDTVKFMSHEELIDKMNSVEDAKSIYDTLCSLQDSDIECDKYTRFKLRDDASVAFMKFE